MTEASTGRVAVADRVRAAALEWVGTPYRHQGSRKGVGCDCLGLVLGVWREIYGALPEEAPAYARDWTEIPGDPLTETARRHFDERTEGPARPGDLVLFRWRGGLSARHAAILLDRDRIVHACEGRAVIVTRLVPQWRRRIAGSYAFPDIPPGNREQ